MLVSPVSSSPSNSLPLISRVPIPANTGSAVTASAVPFPADTATISAAGKAASASTSSPASSASPSSSAKSGAVRSGGGGGGGSISASQISSLMATSFSVSVNGTNYSGSVLDSNGEYTATAAGVAGASGSGNSEIAAENALELSLSELV